MQGSGFKNLAPFLKTRLLREPATNKLPPRYKNGNFTTVAAMVFRPKSI